VRRVVLAAMLASVIAASVATAASNTRLSIPTAGASIAVPASWRALDARTAANSAAFNRFVAQNPSLRPFLAQMQGANSPIKLMALDPTLAQGFATNVNVSRAPAGVTLAQLAAVYEKQLETLLPALQGGVSTRVVSLPATQALRASYRIGFNTNGRKLAVQTLQYVVLRGSKSIVITLSTLPGQAAGRGATFDAIARSLRFA
jgi:hypothetical protein